MSKILCIPDVHLKPKMFDEAHQLLGNGVADEAVCLGDLLDDWGEEFNLALYQRTVEKVLWFQKEHPRTRWVMGNHDFGYYYPEFGHKESGHSKFMEGEMGVWLEEFKRKNIRQRFAEIIDKVIFTHAGISKRWIVEHARAEEDKWEHPEWLDFVLNEDIDYECFWEDDSPLWWRPQEEYGGNPENAWDGGASYLQVVGHSPMRTPTQEGSILSCDVFSTYRNGAPYGDQKWVVVDTKTKEWEKVEHE